MRGIAVVVKIMNDFREGCIMWIIGHGDIRHGDKVRRGNLRVGGV